MTRPTRSNTDAPEFPKELDRRDRAKAKVQMVPQPAPKGRLRGGNEADAKRSERKVAASYDDDDGGGDCSDAQDENEIFGCLSALRIRMTIAYSPNPRHNNRSNHPRPRPNKQTSEADGRSAIDDLRATNDERRSPTGARGLPGAAPACGLWFYFWGKKAPRTPQQSHFSRPREGPSYACVQRKRVCVVSEMFRRLP